MENTIDNFFRTTTIHGLRDLRQAKGLWERRFWSVLFTAATLTSIYFSYEIIKDFVERPTLSSVSDESVPTMRLPHLAVCYMGGPNVTYMKQELRMPDDLISYVVHRFSRNLLVRPFSTNASQIVTLESSLDTVLLRYNLTFDRLLRNIGFKCEALIFLCNFKNCCENSTVIVHPNHGMCFVLRTFEQHIPGIDSGLTLGLFVPPNKDRYNESRILLLNGFGFEIGDPYYHAHMNTFTSSMNGVQQSILHVTQHRRSPSRRGGCRDYPNISSSSGCFMQCTNQVALRYCHCVHPKFSEAINRRYKVCTPFQLDRCESALYTSTRKHFRDYVSECRRSCVPLCNEREYTQTIAFMDIKLDDGDFLRKISKPHKDKELTSYMLITMGYASFSIRLGGKTKPPVVRTDTERKRNIYWDQLLNYNAGTDRYPTVTSGKERCMWISIFGVASTLCLWFCVYIFIDFMQRPTVTSTSSQSLSYMQLPHVAFCTLSGLNVNAMKRLNMSDRLIGKILDYQHVGMTHGRRLKSISRQLLQDENSETELSLLLDRYNWTYSQLIVATGYRCEELVFHCKPANCCQGSRMQMHPNLGPCIVLPKLYQYRPGVESGLTVHLRAPQTPPTSGKRQSILLQGFGMEIGEPYHHATMETYAMSLEHYVHVGLTPQFYKRKKKTAHGCGDNKRISSPAGCYIYCRNVETIKRCGCGDPKFYEFASQNYPVCTPFQMARCLSDSVRWHLVHLNGAKMECEKSCVPLCMEKDFEPQLSYLQLSSASSEEMNTQYNRSTIVSIGYATFSLTHIEEETAFTFQMAVSSLGGQASLWLGCSILSMIHMFVYAIKLCRRSKRKSYAKTLRLPCQ